MGEMWGFLMGWNMVLEHGVGSASVAKAWSGYLDSAMDYPVKVLEKNIARLNQNRSNFITKST